MRRTRNSKAIGGGCRLRPAFRVSAGKGQGGCNAFTLVELLLVMTVMVVAISVSAPVLGNFFRGRTLDAEARRMLALTRAGQNRAVSEGLPMRLWVDTAKGQYGLEAEPGWDDKDPKALQFDLDQDLHLQVLAASQSNRTRSRAGTLPGTVPMAQQPNMPVIRFLPDGSIDETSPRALRLSDRDDTAVWLALSGTRLSYEIRQNYE